LGFGDWALLGLFDFALLSRTVPPFLRREPASVGAVSGLIRFGHEDPATFLTGQNATPLR
jgi:hypothetical protein